MLEKIKKRVQITKKICLIGTYLFLALIAILMFVYKSNIWDKLIVILVLIIVCALFAFFRFTTLIEEESLLDDNVTFISGLFHNYLFINDQLVKKKFAIFNIYNTIKTDYKGHTLEVLFTRENKKNHIRNYVNFYIDGENINARQNIEELFK